jgi:hypothetical protein
MSADWEKLVDKEAEKFREQAYKAAYRFYGSTYAHATADALTDAYIAIVKDREAPEAIKRIFTQEFLNPKQKLMEENKQ